MAKKTKKRKIKRNYSRTIDLFLLLVYIIAVIYSFIALQQMKIIPEIYHYGFILIAFLIFCLFFNSALKKYRKGFRYFKRFILIIIIAVLFSASYLLSTLRTSFDSLSTIASQMYILTKEDVDLNHAVIGIQNGSDARKSLSVQELIQEDYTAQFQEADDYDTLFAQLEDGSIDAVLISNAYYMHYADQNPDFELNYQIARRYQYQEANAKSTLEDVFTVYISGIDTMGSPDQLTRSDTNLLLIVDAIRNRITMISIPRDSFMPNTALQYQNDKFTHMALYGIDTSVASLENFLGIPIDYYARISFQSLISIVDILDGIDVDVEIDFCEQDENRSFSEEDMICLSAGPQTINGKEALAYARHRKTEGYDNPGRERAQRRIIKAMIEKCTSPSMLLHINELLNDMSSYLMTNISSQAIASFVSSELNEISSWEITSLSSSNGVYDYRYCASNDISLGTSSVYLYQSDEVQAIQDAYYGAKAEIGFDQYSFDLNLMNSGMLNHETQGEIIWAENAEFPH